MNDQNNNWKQQSLIIGTVGGAILGALSAYLFARAAEEDADRNGGKPAPIKTGQAISLGLALLALIRQISELGKPQKK